MRTHKNVLLPFFTFVIICCVYISFCINVHTWESYFYAGSIDNFIPVSDMAPPGQDLSIPYNDLICIYYTQHPLLYFGVYFVHMVFPDINPLNIAQTFNMILGIIGFWGVYLILQKLFNDIILSCLGVLLISFIDVYWYQSLSGEVYIGAFSFLSLSFYSLLNVNYSDQHKISKEFLNMSLFYGIAVWFHLYGSIFGLIVAFDILKNNALLRTRLFYLMIFCIISAIFFITAYVLPYLIFTSVNTFSTLSTLLFIHSTIWGIWQIPDHLMPVEIIFSIFTGFKHNLYAIISGNELSVNIIRTFIGIWVGIHFIRYLITPQKNRILNLCLLWFSSYFLVLTTLIHVPNVNDNWCLSLFSLVLFILYSYRSFLISSKGKLLIGFLALMLLMINGTNDVFPKNCVPNKSFFVADGLKEKISSYESILFMGNHNILSQAWNIFYMGKMKASQLRYLHPPYEYSIIVQYQKDLLKIVNTALKHNDKMLLISAENDQYVRLSIHLLQSKGFNVQPIFQKKISVNPKIYKVALGIIKETFELKYVAYQISIR